MEIKKLVAATAITACAFGVGAQEYKFVAKDASLATQVCVHAGNNNTSGTKHVMQKLYGNQKALSANSIRCNDLSLAQFTYKYGATDTFKYLNRYSYDGNKVEPTTSIKDIAALDFDSSKSPIIVEVYAKR